MDTIAPGSTFIDSPGLQDKVKSEYDGLKRAEIQIEKSRLGKGGSLWVGLMLPF